ncbi:MAG: beta-lactamase family protein [Thermoleophilia bacterium]|nr:beta-lactamase family protein [Thermoleophilia bacterium]
MDKNDALEGFESVAAVARAAMEELAIPGVALALWSGGVQQELGLGITSVENPLPVEADTIFQAGSITKTVTATAAVRLVEEGRLDLDAPVRGLLPRLRLEDDAVAGAVTMRHLLSHGGGWVGDYFDDFGWGEDALERYVAACEGLPQLSPLGELWSYNNAGFSIAGRALEVAARESYEQVVLTRVLEPLGMERSYFFPWDVMTRRFAVGHLVDEEGGGARVARPWPVPRASAPAGGLVTTVRDLLRFARAHMEDPSLAPLREPGFETGYEHESMGLAWFVKDRDGVRLAEHGGTTLGQNAWLVFAPERDFAAAVLTNHQHGSTLIIRVLEHAYQVFLGIEPWQPTEQVADPAALEEVAGRYEARMSDIDVRVEGRGLVLQLHVKGGFPKPDSPPIPAPPPAAATLYDADRIVVTDGVLKSARGQLIRGAEGQIVWLRFGRRVHRRV